MAGAGSAHRNLTFEAQLPLAGIRATCNASDVFRTAKNRNATHPHDPVIQELLAALPVLHVVVIVIEITFAERVDPEQLLQLFFTEFREELVAAPPVNLRV